MSQQLEEIDDLENAIPEDVSNRTNNTIIIDHGISYQERQDAFEKEWIDFLKKEITSNIECNFHLWFTFAANESFILKMEKLANKHFRGILNKESLMRLQIYVKQLQYAIMGLQRATKTTNLEMILTFIETFTQESFEAMDHWNWPLTTQNMSKLMPYRSEDLVAEPELDRSMNEGLPSWIKLSKCDCEDS
jgi:hypothetical protein